MKNVSALLVLVLGVLSLTSCGYHSAMVGNINSNVTHVELGENNFTVVDRVRGQSTATYIFGIGGLSNKSLVERAKSAMLENASLVGASKAIINLTTESHVTIVYPILFRKTITVSGHVVQFD